MKAMLLLQKMQRNPPITQWYWYRYRPISHIPISELELGLSVKFGISGINLRMYLVWCCYHQTATLKDLILKEHMHGQTDKDNRIAALTPQNYAWPKFEPTVSILYCSSISVTCIMHNAVTLLHPKYAITRYGTANKRPVNARVHCIRASVHLTLQKVPN